MVDKSKLYNTNSGEGPIVEEPADDPGIRYHWVFSSKRGSGINYPWLYKTWHLGIFRVEWWSENNTFTLQAFGYDEEFVDICEFSSVTELEDMIADNFQIKSKQRLLVMDLSD